MKYKVQHLGRNNLQDETGMGTAGSQIRIKEAWEIKGKSKAKI